MARVSMVVSAGPIGAPLRAVDEDRVETFTWSIVGDLAGLVAVNSSTGQISQAAPTLDFEAVTQVVVTVRVADHGGRTADALVRLVWTRCLAPHCTCVLSVSTLVVMCGTSARAHFLTTTACFPVLVLCIAVV